MAWIAGNKDPYGGAVAQSAADTTADSTYDVGTLLATQVPASVAMTLSGGSTPKVWFVNGVPSNGVGSNGDYAFRLDGTGGATRFYQKAAGAWAAVIQVN